MKAHLRGEPKGADELLRIAYKPHLLPVLNQEVGERYAIPPSSPATITYTWLPLDEIEDALQRSAAMRPLSATPLHDYHDHILQPGGAV